MEEQSRKFKARRHAARPSPNILRPAPVTTSDVPELSEARACDQQYPEETSAPQASSPRIPTPQASSPRIPTPLTTPPGSLMSRLPSDVEESDQFLASEEFNDSYEKDENGRIIFPDVPVAAPLPASDSASVRDPSPTSDPAPAPAPTPSVSLSRPASTRTRAQRPSSPLVTPPQSSSSPESSPLQHLRPMRSSRQIFSKEKVKKGKGKGAFMCTRSLKMMPITDVKSSWNLWKKEETAEVMKILKKNKAKTEIECSRCSKFIEHGKFLRHSTVRGCPAIHPFFKLTEFKKNFANKAK